MWTFKCQNSDSQNVPEIQVCKVKFSIKLHLWKIHNTWWCLFSHALLHIVGQQEKRKFFLVINLKHNTENFFSLCVPFYLFQFVVPSVICRGPAAKSVLQAVLTFDGFLDTVCVLVWMWFPEKSTPPGKCILVIQSVTCHVTDWLNLVRMFILRKRSYWALCNNLCCSCFRYKSRSCQFFNR